MFRQYFAFVITAVSFVLALTVQAQEFPIAVGSDSTFSAGAVYGGNNGLVAICGDSISPNSITAQLVGAPGNLIGPRISLGATGVVPGAIPIFDGTNYFLVWREFNGDLQGQFIDTTGNLVGPSFTVATNTLLEIRFLPHLAFDGSNFLVIFVKNDGYLYGQRVSPAGILVGSQIQISSNHAREISLAYDGANYLAAWVEVISGTDKDIYGQFVSASGSLVGTNFLIDGGPLYSDNPTSLAFDGTRYFLAYHETPSTDSSFTIMGRFITTSGAIEETITICDASEDPENPSVAFDNTNYLVTWLQGSTGSLMGRFYDTAGLPLDPPFEIFAPAGNKMPVGGVGFGGNLYLAVATRVDSSFSDGDVYGRFIQPLATGIETKNPPIAFQFMLFQNYPNPFNPTTNLGFRISKSGLVTLKVYDVLGNEAATLVNEVKPAGEHNIAFDASHLPSGVYLYRLSAGSYSQTRKMILLK